MNYSLRTPTNTKHGQLLITEREIERGENNHNNSIDSEGELFSCFNRYM